MPQRLESPWPAFNELLALRPGTVTTVVSLSGVGKSTLALNIATHAVADQHASVAYTTTEMNVRQVHEKTMAAHIGADIRNDTLDTQQLSTLRAFGLEMDRLPFRVLPLVGMHHDVGVIERLLDEMHADGKPADLLVVDSIQGIHEPSDPDGPRNVMGTLRLLSDLHDVAVLAVSHLKEPTRTSPGLEAIQGDVVDRSDTVLALHRSTKYWDFHDPDDPSSTITVLKGSNPGAVIPLVLQAPYARFVSEGSE
ncbi:DnaB-like helicase C-terminal domain-containing protein [Streptacidiphilus sp. EB129]|uniref:DnaB-like helicase C-terminal domain-containing protein n=1 Tax=Streptacidiphilus sp. EB129 TaxID=3156262 RepID=UPI0035196A1E